MQLLLGKTHKHVCLSYTCTHIMHLYNVIYTHTHIHTHHRMNTCHNYRIRSTTWNATLLSCKLPTPTNANLLMTQAVANWTPQAHMKHHAPLGHMITSPSHMIPLPSHMTQVDVHPRLRNVDHLVVDLSESLLPSQIRHHLECSPLPLPPAGHSWLDQCSETDTNLCQITVFR